MISPERQEQISPQPLVRLEYSGNFAQAIEVNHRLLSIAENISGAAKPLIITDGKETAEQVFPHAINFSNGRWRFDFSKESKPPAVLYTNSKGVYVLVINPQVIDGRIQQKQRLEGFGADAYRSLFINGLKHIISEALERWAYRELAGKRNPLFLPMTRRFWELASFFRKNKDQLVIAALGPNQSS